MPQNQRDVGRIQIGDEVQNHAVLLVRDEHRQVVDHGGVDVEQPGGAVVGGCGRSGGHIGKSMRPERKRSRGAREDPSAYANVRVSVRP